MHEYVTGGGWPEESFPQGLAREGASMIDAMLAQFNLWGKVRFLTTRDSRLKAPEKEIARTITLHHKDYPGNLRDLMQQTDAALIIAPEDDGVLEELSTLALGCKNLLLGSSPVAVGVCSDKWQTLKVVKQLGLKAPVSFLVDKNQVREKAKELGYPLILKPVNASDCAGLSLVNKEDNLLQAFGAACQGGEKALIQEYIPGQAASVSLWVKEGRAGAFSLNLQNVEGVKGFSYQGGVANIGHHLREEAFSLAGKAVEAIPGLKGYCGVDVVLGQEGVWFMEINPRLTTSVVGLCLASVDNFAKALWQACSVEIKGLPRMGLSGEVHFTKESPYA